MTRPRLRWWREVLYVLAFYGVYSFIRNQFGSAAVDPAEAFENAERVIAVERAVGLYHEETLQAWFIDWTWFIQGWNIFYGTFHFIVTAGALIWMFRSFPGRYPRWRNTLAFTTALALIGFSTFPLMPPRLLPEIDASYEYVDTLAEVGGLWSFDDSAMEKVSNQYAAMPSLHFAWSSWSFFVLYPQLRRRWTKALVAAYPWLTLFAIMVTANHFWLDAVGGALVLGLGFVLAGWFTAATRRRLEEVPEVELAGGPAATAPEPAQEPAQEPVQDAAQEAAQEPVQDDEQEPAPRSARPG